MNVIFTNAFKISHLRSKMITNVLPIITRPCLFTENKLFLPDSMRRQVLFPTKCGEMPALQGQDLPRVRAMFFKCPWLGWSRLLDWALTVARPVCRAAVQDQMRAPRVCVRRFVPVESRPLMHSSNLISCDFITGGGRKKCQCGP